MLWKEYLKKSFGRQDKAFANHPNDQEHARNMLLELARENIPWEDVETEAKQWLEAEGCSQEHIKEQLVYMRDLATYLPSKQ